VIVSINGCGVKRMTEHENKILAALNEISMKIDRLNENLEIANQSLNHLCQYEDAKRREQIQKETAIQHNIDSMKRDMEKRREEFTKKFNTPIFRETK
jgi:uncharacterized protein Yka (UPF0111/DUF47 family)